MKFIFIVLLSLLILISSCSSTHIVKQVQSDYKILNKKFQGEECDMITNNNVKIAGRNIGIFGDSLYCIDANSASEIIMHTSVVNKITVIENFTGALEGCGIGALIGLGLGGFNYFNLSETEKEDPLARGVIVLSTLGGGLWGLAIGALIGHKDTYVFESLPDTTKMK